MKYNVPEGTQNGTVFRLRDKGVVTPGSRSRGDQYVRLAVEGQKPVKFAGCAGGRIPSVEEIVEAAKNALKEAE